MARRRTMRPLALLLLLVPALGSVTHRLTARYSNELFNGELVDRDLRRLDGDDAAAADAAEAQALANEGEFCLMLVWLSFYVQCTTITLTHDERR